MRFMFKIVVWGFLALMILPSIFPNAQITEDDQNIAVAHTATDTPLPTQAFSFALNLAGDLQSLCQRQPDICETGGELVSSAFERAQTGAIIAMQMIEDHRAQRREEVDMNITASVK